MKKLIELNTALQSKQLANYKIIEELSSRLSNSLDMQEECRERLVRAKSELVAENAIFQGKMDIIQKTWDLLEEGV